MNVANQAMVQPQVKKEEEEEDYEDDDDYDDNYEMETITSAATPVAAGSSVGATPAELRSLIAKDLTKLTNEQRERVFEDVHGISSETNEDPAFIKTCLDDLEEHLNKIKANTSYELAEKKCPEYVRNSDFRLMFIRADFYVSKAAAERMIKFFEFKKKLFGEEKLGKEITLDDFGEDGIEIMRSGYAQISPHKDMAGRPIVFFVLKHKKFEHAEYMTKAGFYIFMAATQMPEAQRKGIACVYYYLDLVDRDALRATNSESRKALPVYFSSLHLCYNDEIVYERLCGTVANLNSSTRARFRTHRGNHEQVANELSDYGIPRQSIPVTPDGKYSLDSHRKWLEERLTMERNLLQTPGAVSAPSMDAVAQAGPVISAVPTKSFRCISDESSVGSTSTMSMSTGAKKPVAVETLSSAPKPTLSLSSSIPSSSDTPRSSLGVTPLPDDVLFGRGKTVVEHPGNTRFRHVVDIYMNEYESAGRLEKTCIAEVIVRMVKDANGRFLKRDDGGDWEEVDDSTARKKVAHAFRNRRKLHGY